MIYKIMIDSLIRIFNEDAYLNKIISNIVEDEKYSIHERKLYAKLVYGVVENKILLDYYLQPYTKGNRIKPFVRNALRVGAYAITYLDLANHYVVDKLVETVKKKDFNASKMVNGVLRNYAREERRVLPTQPLNHMLSIKYSIPLDLIDYLLEIYPDLEKILAGLCHNAKINSYRINYLKVRDLAEIKEKLNSDVLFEDNMIYSSTSLIQTEIFQKGLIVAQDYSSTLPVEVLDPKPNERCLDACAAPGMKTIQMAEKMKNKGKIIALEIHEHKISLIKENIDRLGATNIEPILEDATKVEFTKDQSFDKILIDAPCSGLGVIGHKPDLKYRMTKLKVREIANLQYQILTNCAKYLKVGGELVYSTCTITKIENSELIRKFINNFVEAKYEIITETQILPDISKKYLDGFYICKIKRIA